MINVIARASNVAPYFKATTQSVSSGLKPIATAIPVKCEKLRVQSVSHTFTKQRLNEVLFTGKIGIQSGVAGYFNHLYII